MSDSVRPHGQQPTRLLCPWESPGKNNGVGCHFFFSNYLYKWLRVWAFDQLDMGLRPRPVVLRAVALANYLISLNLHFIICNNVPMF